MKMKIGKRDRASGLTLIEVLIIVGLVIILGAIALPTVQRISLNYNLRSAARDIAADFALHKERAVSENRMYRITFNVGANNYSIRACASPGSDCPAWNSTQVKSLSEFGQDIALQAARTTEWDYYLQTRGTVTAGSIALANQRGSNAKITVNITGKTSVQFDMR